MLGISIPGFPSWREIFDHVKGFFEDTYSILKKSWSDVTGAVSSAIDALPSWAKKTFDDAVDDFIDGFQRRFAASETRAVAFLTALGIGAGDVITTILDTPGEMLSWIRPDLENAYDIVTHKWSEVTGAISTAIGDLSDIVDHSWSEVTGAVSSATATLAATIADLKVPELWTWVNDAPGWFVDQFNGMKETVVDWVVERFEGILDRVFKE